MRRLDIPSIEGISEELRTGAKSPVALVEHALQRIAAIDTAHTIFLSVAAESALAEAGRAEKEIRDGGYRGPLHGIPFSVKDLYQVRGTTRTCGARIPIDGGIASAEDAAAVALLRQAGAILIGKTNLHEFGCGATGINPHFGYPSNPWDPERIPGGSSSGSAVEIARGISFFSLGTDTGGSVRIPAALCGIVGFKPSFDRLSTRGVFPLAPSLDHVGILARSVRDAACVFSCLDGNGTRPRVHPKWTAALAVETLETADAEVVDAVLAAVQVLRNLDVNVVRLRAGFLEEADAVSLTISRAESGEVHRRWLAERSAEYGVDVLARLQAGSVVPRLEVEEAIRSRERLIQISQSVWTAADVLLTPTVPITAPRIEHCNSDALITRLTANTRPFNLLGTPACTIPCPGEGLPVGITISGPSGHDATVLQIAAAYEKASRKHWPTMIARG